MLSTAIEILSGMVGYAFAILGLYLAAFYIITAIVFTGG